MCLCPGSGGWSASRPCRDDQSKLPSAQLYDMAADVGEQTNLRAERPEVVGRRTALLDEFVADGRSTPGAPGTNDKTAALTTNKYMD